MSVSSGLPAILGSLTPRRRSRSGRGLSVRPCLQIVTNPQGEVNHQFVPQAPHAAGEPCRARGQSVECGWPPRRPSCRIARTDPPSPQVRQDCACLRRRLLQMSFSPDPAQRGPGLPNAFRSLRPHRRAHPMITGSTPLSAGAQTMFQRYSPALPCRTPAGSVSVVLWDPSVGPASNTAGKGREIRQSPSASTGCPLHSLRSRVAS